MRVWHQAARFIIPLAWVLFVVSFFLPASNVVALRGTEPGTPLTGWQTFTSSLIVLAAQPLIVVAEPRTVLFLAFPLVNLAGLLAPIVLAWDDCWALSWLFLICGIVPWVFPKSVTGDLFIGFYLWNFSFFADFIGCILVSVSRKQAFAAQIRRLNENAV